jgi:hypothetical protein
VFNATFNNKVCHWLATGRWFSPGTPVSSINKTDRHDITKILLKVALNTITLTLYEVWSTKSNHSESYLNRTSSGPTFMLNHRPVASQWQTLSHNVLWNTPHLSLIKKIISKINTHNNIFLHISAKVVVMEVKCSSSLKCSYGCNTYCVVFFSVLCTLCCQFLWIVSQHWTPNVKTHNRTTQN